MVAIDKTLKYALSGICVIGLSATLYEAVPPLAKEFLLQKRDPEVQNYVEENLENILEAQEQKMNLTLFFPKKIQYLLPIEETDPNTLGLYNNQTDTIYLQSGRLTTPGFNWGDFLALITTRDLEETKRVLDHELGHFYCDKLSESLGKGSWHSEAVFNHSQKESISIILVAEGIAEYFERIMNGGEDAFKDSSWPKNLNGFYFNQNVLFYDGGYHLVKPIIKKYGEKGIIYLLFKFPNKKELLDLPAYQKKALKELNDPSTIPELLGR